MENLHFLLLLLSAISVIHPNFAIPSEYSHFISEPVNEELDKNNVVDNFLTPEIYEMHISSHIQNRFAKTMVRSKIRNIHDSAQETTFFVDLPEAAFISEFIMEVDNKNLTAYLKRKEEARRQYDEAKRSGLAAAYIATSFRDCNRFMVSVNIKPQAKAAFYLTYEELLNKKQGNYEHIININPRQLVQNLNVEVFIKESLKLTLVEARLQSSGKEVLHDELELNTNVKIDHINDFATKVQFSPDLEKQKQLSRALKTAEEDGLTGQFVVQYDVERYSGGGEVLLRDGYFVHFFAPSGLEPLPKHVIFLLDTSSSMKGNRIAQLKQAMTQIFDQMHDRDLFHLVEFNTNVKVWNVNDFSQSVWFPMDNEDFDWDYYDENESEISVENFVFPNAAAANSDNIQKAKSCISKFDAEGIKATDIYSAFKVALHLVNTTQQMKPDNVTRQSIIIFLTDGVPNIRYSDTTKILINIRKMNKKLRASIFGLSFGDEADKYFTGQLAKSNLGFSRHIYEDVDASRQLENFYDTISSPLLKDVKFKYNMPMISLTIDTYPIYFDGSELMVAGFCGSHSTNFSSYVTGYNNNTRSNLIPVVKRSISSMERIWAYLTIKQLLENKEGSDEERNEFQEKATQLALKYSFVTPVTSLVVVQQNDSYWVNLENKEDDQPSLIVLPSTDSSVSANLKTTLSWQNNMMVNEDGYINEDTSGNYKIASGYDDITEEAPCPKTPINETTGICKLLDFCPQVYTALADISMSISNIFTNYSCIIQNKYVGICCPNITFKDQTII